MKNKLEFTYNSKSVVLTRVEQLGQTFYKEKRLSLPANQAFPPLLLLARLKKLIEKPSFKVGSLEERFWKKDFAEMIILTDNLLMKASNAGHRIDFIKGVGVGGKVQDITSLVAWMRKQLSELESELIGGSSTSRLNRYYNAGTGYFENGAFFTVEYDDELGFFIDNQRIYLNQQIKRVLRELEILFHSPS